MSLNVALMILTMIFALISISAAIYTVMINRKND